MPGREHIFKTYRSPEVETKPPEAADDPLAPLKGLHYAVDEIVTRLHVLNTAHENAMAPKKRKEYVEKPIQRDARSLQHRIRKTIEPAFPKGPKARVASAFTSEVLERLTGRQYPAYQGNDWWQEHVGKPVIPMSDNARALFVRLTLSSQERRDEDWVQQVRLQEIETHLASVIPLPAIPSHEKEVYKVMPDGTTVMQDEDIQDVDQTAPTVSLEAVWAYFVDDFYFQKVKEEYSPI
jgi:hypothetical protein